MNQQTYADKVFAWFGLTAFFFRFHFHGIRCRGTEVWIELHAPQLVQAKSRYAIVTSKPTDIREHNPRLVSVIALDIKKLSMNNQHGNWWMKRCATERA